MKSNTSHQLPNKIPPLKPPNNKTLQHTSVKPLNGTPKGTHLPHLPTGLLHANEDLGQAHGRPDLFWGVACPQLAKEERPRRPRRRPAGDRWKPFGGGENQAVWGKTCFFAGGSYFLGFLLFFACFFVCSGFFKVWLLLVGLDYFDFTWSKFFHSCDLVHD